MRYSLDLNREIYIWTLFVSAALFIVTHPLLSYVHYQQEEVHWLVIQLFDLDDENNLPTWFSSFLLTNACLLTLMHAQRAIKMRMHWFLLAFGFLVLAIDEVAGVHETINSAIEISWVIPAAILVTALAVVFLPFAWRLWQIERAFILKLTAAGFLYLSGVLGIEWLSADMEEESLQYEYAVTVEEGLEMLGIWLYLATLSKHVDKIKRLEKAT